MLSKLGVRPPEEQLPFDMVRCTMDGVVQFTRQGFYPTSGSHPTDGFFPGPLDARPWPMDPASIWPLFRGQHTCFTHYDLNSDAVVNVFEQRFKAWEEMLTHGHRPVTFLRTIISERPEDEIAMLSLFAETLRDKNPVLDYRVVMVIHDDPAAPPETDVEEVEETQQVCMLNDNAMLWQLRLQGEPTESLFDRCHDGYKQIIEYAQEDAHWGPQLLERYPRPELLRFKRQKHLSRVEGLTAFKGTCVGFGSTLNSAAKGACIYCGNDDGHAFTEAELVRWNSGRPWTGTAEDGEAELWALVRSGVVPAEVVQGVDFVAAVEHMANTTNRSAYEVLQRIQYHQEQHSIGKINVSYADSD